MPGEGGGQKRILLNGENTLASTGRRIEASVVTLLSSVFCFAFLHKRRTLGGWLILDEKGTLQIVTYAVLAVTR